MAHANTRHRWDRSIRTVALCLPNWSRQRNSNPRTLPYQGSYEPSHICRRNWSPAWDSKPPSMIYKTIASPPMLAGLKNGAEGGARSPDLLCTKQALSLLSYFGMERVVGIASRHIEIGNLAHFSCVTPANGATRQKSNCRLGFGRPRLSH
jgi:hypothetical protein